LVFADLLFLFVFLPVCLFFYFVTNKLAFRNVVLIVFSLLFYAWGEPIWVTLLLFSSVLDYTCGRVIDKHRGKLQAKAALISSIVLNLGLLATFKYSGFVVSTVNSVIGTGFNAPRFRLPIGISFYTFQTLSYTIDIYRGKVRVQKSFPRFLMFVSLFPQLIAGPIVRYGQIEKEINDRKTDIRDISYGITRFIFGLTKKVIIANTAGELSAKYLDGDLSSLPAAAAWFGLTMFTIQIYYDFSGYSDMAIGLGKIFGFNFPENFNYPYAATSITDFWRRWHMTLSTFFKDYLYIPLGGNRRHMYLNLFIVWFATGLWHGASMNFVLWGMYYLILICAERLFLRKILIQIPEFVGRIYALFGVIIGWAIFYFTDLTRLSAFFTAAFGANKVVSRTSMLVIDISNNIIWLIVAVLFCFPISRVAANIFEMIEEKKFANAFVVTGILQALAGAALLFICVIFLARQSYNPFLYWNF